MKDKFTLLYIPFLLLLLVMLIGYTALHWLLCIQFEVISIKQVGTNFLIPMILSGAVVVLIMRPRVKILNLDSKKRSSRHFDFYYIILWLSFAVPTIIAQEYIVKATGKLTELNSINEIDEKADTKYYSLSNFYLDKENKSTHADFTVTGKFNENLNISIYLAVPILDNVTETLQNNCKAWLGIKYSKQISNRLDAEKKEEAFQQFWTKSINEYNAKYLSKFVYLHRLNETDDQIDFYEKAIAQNTAYNASDVILTPHNEPFEARNGGTFTWILISSAIACIVWLIMILIPSINKKEKERIKKGKPDAQAIRERKDLLTLMIPVEGFFITPILMYINIIVFLLMFFFGLGFISFDGTDLLNWGANYAPKTNNGEWWRLLTCMFLHGGVVHVLFNMYGLLFVGIWLEPLLGKVYYLAFYLAAGIVSSIASVWWYDNTISVGASGAIFGLYGVFIALMVTKVYAKEFSNIFLAIAITFVGINLVMGLFGGIDNAAHLGGVVSGFIIGLLYSLWIKKSGVSV